MEEINREIVDYKTKCENYSQDVGCYNTFDGTCIENVCFTYRLLQELSDADKNKQILNRIREILNTHLEIGCGPQSMNHQLKDAGKRELATLLLKEMGEI